MPSTTRDLNVPLIALIAVVGVTLLFVLITGVQAWFQFEQNKEAAAKNSVMDSYDLRELKREQLANLAPGTDPATGEDRVGIAAAIERVAAQYKRPGAEDEAETPAEAETEAVTPRAVEPGGGVDAEGENSSNASESATDSGR